MFLIYSKEIYKLNFRQYGEMKSRAGEAERRKRLEEKNQKRKIRRKKTRRERVRRQKMQMYERVGNSRNTVFFQ